MSNQRKSRTRKNGDGFIGRLFAQTTLPAHVTEEQDWYLDTPDVRLTRVFTVVLVLHVVAVGGILAFKMVEKASGPAVITIAEESAAAPEAEAASAAAAAAPVAPARETAAARAPGRSPATDPLLVDHPSTQEYQEYRVGSGESLISIARKLNVSATEIRELNNLGSGSNLTVGRWIRVPKASPAPASAVAAADPSPEPAPAPAVARAETPAAAPVPRAEPVPAPVPRAEPTPVPAPSPAPAAGAGQASYQVQKGDTLFGIARRFGVKHQDLMAANNIDTPERLQAGQTIKVPRN